MYRIKKITMSVIIVVLSVLIIVFSAEVSKSVSDSINVCITLIIPSMFAYMVISSYIVSSGLSRIIAKPFHFIFKRIIRLGEDDFCIFLMSLLGGYPVGAKLLKEKTSENINYSEIAESMLCFCYCISPSFAVTMLGLGVFGSIDAGVIIYISNAISCFICAIIMTHSRRMSSEGSIISNRKGIINAINSATSSLAVISAVIISFNIVLTIITESLERIGIGTDMFLLGFIEISNLLKLGNVTPALLPIVSAIASFGGVCVLCQCTAICGNKLNFSKFLAARIPCSVLSGFVTSVLMNFWEISVQTGISPNYSYSFSADKLVVVILIAMSIIIFRKSEKIFKKV